jgi:hypothetical protein
MKRQIAMVYATIVTGLCSGAQILVLSEDHTVIPDGGAPTSFGSQFPAVLVDGGSVFKPFAIVNTGTTTLAIPNGGLDITGTHASDFTVSPGGFTIEPGDAMLPPVEFNPSGLGVRNAVLTISSNSATSATYVVKLRGLGVDGIPSLPNLSVEPVGITKVKSNKDGSTRVKAAFRVTNPGALDVDSGIAQVYFSPNYWIEENATPALTLPIKSIRGLLPEKAPKGRNLKVTLNVGPLQKGAIFMRVLPSEPSPLDVNYAGNQRFHTFEVGQ